MENSGLKPDRRSLWVPPKQGKQSFGRADMASLDVDMDKPQQTLTTSKKWYPS